MLTYDIELDELLKRYNLYYSDEESFLETLVLNNYQGMEVKENIVIWGAGRYTKELMELIPSLQENVMYIVDNNEVLQGKELFGLKICSPQLLKQEPPDVIIISSVSYREQIQSEIYDLVGDEVIVVDLNEGVDAVPVPFYFSPRELIDIHVNKIKYRKCAIVSEQENLLLLLIKQYLRIRDFIYAKQYINEYASRKFENYEALLDFQIELDNLLINLKNKLKLRKKNDVALLILDSLRAKDIENDNSKMPFLQDLSAHSIKFSNAFSTSTYTHTSVISMLTNEIYTGVKDDNIKYGIDFNKSNLLTHLERENYHIYNYSILDFFGSDNRTIRKFAETKQAKTLNVKINQPISQVFWEYICQLVEDSHNTFSLLHISETHIPHICANHESLSTINDPVVFYINAQEKKYSAARYSEQYVECMNYVDNQMKFYFEYFPENLSMVVCSDHGQAIGEHNAFGHVFTWYDEVIKVPLIFYRKGIMAKVVNQLFSLENLSDTILSFITDDTELKVPSRELIYMFREQLLNPSFINNKAFISSLGEKFKEGFFVVRSQFDKYISYCDGKEEYFLLPNEQENLIKNTQYLERIEYLREDLKKTKHYSQYIRGVE